MIILIVGGGVVITLCCFYAISFMAIILGYANRRNN
jgi:hypothetical protein